MIKMMWDNVLIKKLERKGNVIIADKQAGRPDRGEVVLVGPCGYYGYQSEVGVSTSVRKGDKVLFVKDRAMEVELTKGDTYYIVQERDVLGVLEEKEAKDA